MPGSSRNPTETSAHRKAPSQVLPISFPLSQQHHTPRFWRNLSTPHWFPPVQWWIISDCVSPHQPECWQLPPIYSAQTKKVPVNKSTKNSAQFAPQFPDLWQQKVTMRLIHEAPSWWFFLPNGPEISILDLQKTPRCQGGENELKSSGIKSRHDLGGVHHWWEPSVFFHRAEDCFLCGGGVTTRHQKNNNLPLEDGEYVDIT